jgi:hypothetical protein
MRGMGAGCIGRGPLDQYEPASFEKRPLRVYIGTDVLLLLSREDLYDLTVGSDHKRGRHILADAAYSAMVLLKSGQN